MGRAKQSLDLIKEGRTRSITFKKRKEGLKKKAHELKVLCDVEVCLIVSGPASVDGSTTTRELEIWPQNPDQVQHLIDSYMSQSKEDRNRRTENLSSFFEKKRQNIESDLLKLRKTNEMAQYPTWDERYDNFSYEQLIEVGTYLKTKIADARRRIETMKATQIGSSSATTFTNDFMVSQPQHVSSSSNLTTFPLNYYPFHQNQQGQIFHQNQQGQIFHQNQQGQIFHQNQQGQGSIQPDEHHMLSHPLMMIPPQLNNSDYFYNNQFGGMSSNNAPYIKGCYSDGNFSTPPVGYFGNGNIETQMMMAPYMQQAKTKTEDIQAWYGQMMESLNYNQV